jgi:primosomal protein N' (replication factor Y)
VGRFARVVVESDLLQLDREFDFVIPERLEKEILFGQRVSFLLGRAKKEQSGFVIEIRDDSKYATTELISISSVVPVLTRDLFEFCKAVSLRQCVALGEILKAAIPDHMPRSAAMKVSELGKIERLEPLISLDTPLTKRSAVLTSARTVSAFESNYPDWALLFLHQAHQALSQQRSVILIAPETSDIEILAKLAKKLGLDEFIVEMGPGAKKSDRFRAFHKSLASGASLVIGTRSAIYAPVNELGLIAMFDDLDESLKEQGSPFTHARELVLMRAGDHVQLLFAANYRSVEIQRLVSIGYLSDHSVKLPPPRISFTEPGARVDETAFRLIREQLKFGPVLILMPRKGSSAAVFCSGCDEKLKCVRCGGWIWEPTVNRFECRICKVATQSCSACKGANFRKGRTGSSRTVSELGRAFPQVLISEATADKQPSDLKEVNQIVVATPGAAPRIAKGYAGVVVLDSDVWLSMQSMRAELNAIRDWQEAIELMAPDGRAVIAGLGSALGIPLSLQQHRELANQALRELTLLKLPPMVRVCLLTGSAPTIEEALDICSRLGATVLRTDMAIAEALISFSYNLGPAIAKELRALALKTNARLVGANKRRGLRIAMDDQGSL